MSSLRPLAALVAALGCAGCWVPLERGRQMEARIERLEVESRAQALELQDQVKQKLGQMDQKLREVQAKLDELKKLEHEKGADLGVTVSQLKEELVRIHGDLEAQQHLLAELDRQVQSNAREVDSKLASLKGTGALDEAQARQKLSELSRPDDKAAVLALARKEDETGSAGVARELYLHYVRRWPRDDRADDAGFRAGELLATQSRWREAVVVFGKVAEDHPKSDKAPLALLQVAEGMIHLERKEDAKAFLEQVVNEYPKSEAAAKAKARLAELFPAPAKDPHKAPAKKK